MTGKILSFPARNFCPEVPQSMACTNRLHEGKCPGATSGKCCSTELNEEVHNVNLPKFFDAQH
jgi:hypothetical protein